MTTALLLGVSLIASPAYAQSTPGIPDDDDRGGGGNNGDVPSAPGPDRDTDENTIFGNPFGGHLSSDPVTARIVSDYVHGARTLDHIIVDRSGEVIELRPAPEAEQMSWYETPAANW